VGVNLNSTTFWWFFYIIPESLSKIKPVLQGGESTHLLSVIFSLSGNKTSAGFGKLEVFYITKENETYFRVEISLKIATACG